MYFNKLTQEEIKKIKYKIFSLYPFIYYKLVNFKEINFNIDNQEINLAFKNLFLVDNFNSFNTEKIIYEVNNILKRTMINVFLKNIGDWLLYTKKEKEFYYDLDYKNIIIEFSKLFFVYNQATENCFKKTRLNFIEIKKKSDSTEDKVFLHDGWWNNYFGLVVDDKSKKLLSKEIKDKQLMKKRKKENIVLYYKTYLTYAYRLTEIDKFKKAKKILTKKLRFFFINFFFYYLKKEIIYTANNKIFNILYSFLIAKFDISRFKTNFLMLLYRLQDNDKKKLKLIKKIDKINNYQKLGFFLSILKLPSRTFSNVKTLFRPQQILKSIEYSVDKYVITNDKKILTYINYLIIEFIRCICFNYYSTNKNLFLNYSIFLEFFFILFYIMEKIYNIDIQEY